MGQFIVLAFVATRASYHQVFNPVRSTTRDWNNVIHMVSIVNLFVTPIAVPFLCFVNVEYIGICMRSARFSQSCAALCATNSGLKSPFWGFTALLYLLFIVFIILSHSFATLYFVVGMTLAIILSARLYILRITFALNRSVVFWGCFTVGAGFCRSTCFAVEFVSSCAATIFCKIFNRLVLIASFACRHIASHYANPHFVSSQGSVSATFSGINLDYMRHCTANRKVVP